MPLADLSGNVLTEFLNHLEFNELCGSNQNSLTSVVDTEFLACSPVWLGSKMLPVH